MTQGKFSPLTRDRQYNAHRVAFRDLQLAAARGEFRVDTMKYYPVTLLALLASALSALAQLDIEVVLDQEKYLPAEQVVAGIRIVNRSGQTLTLGEDADWAQFTVEKLDMGGIHQATPPPLQGAFTLESGKQATVKVDIAPSYDLRRQGRYVISAIVKIKEWNQSLTTKPAQFEVVEGTKLWEQSFGVPAPAGIARPPEMRKYALQQANYLKNQLRLYCRVSAGDGQVIKMLNVGPMIGFGQPEPQIDSQSRLHILYQYAAKTFSYLIVTPDGEIVLRQSYEYTDTRPRLRLDDFGKIVVTGGMRLMSDNDLPAPVKVKDEGKVLNP